MKTRVEILQGDITKISADVIVNAANPNLAGGGGVDGAINKAGGPSIMEELSVIRQKMGKCPAGEAVITSAGNLPARWVVHAVGPVWQGGNRNEPALLESAYRNSLLLAIQRQASSISFPNISTGVFGYPKDKAAPVALRTVLEFIKKHPIAFAKIFFVCFDDENFNIYQSKYSEYF